MCQLRADAHATPLLLHFWERRNATIFCLAENVVGVVKKLDKELHIRQNTNNVAFERHAVRILSFDAYFFLKFLQKMYVGGFQRMKTAAGLRLGSPPTFVVLLWFTTSLSVVRG